MANESSLSNENTKVTLELSSSSSLTKKALLLSSSQDDDDAAVKSNDHEKGAMDDHPHEDDDDDDDATKNMYKNHGSGGGGTNLSTSTSIENIISLSSSMDERFEAEREANKLRHWREGPYAAGLVEVSWNDERLKQLQHRRRPDSTTTTTTSTENRCCEDVAREEMDPTCGCLYVSGIVCSRLGAGRIGNMIVLKDGPIVRKNSDGEATISDAAAAVAVATQDDDEDLEQGNHELSSLSSSSANDKARENLMMRTSSSLDHSKNNHNHTANTAILTDTTDTSATPQATRKISLIVGPYWPMMLFVTYPIILFVTFLTAKNAIFKQGGGLYKHSLPLTIVWCALSLGLCYSLFSVSCRDPGILLRHHNPPPSPPTSSCIHDSSSYKQQQQYSRGTWRWNDKAQTYKPPGAFYDTDCAVVIEDFDHTCPWTGTAIGKKNMPAFQAFIALVFICLVMDMVLLTAGSTLL
eukprot:CAMPEP_0184865598 /NCGR_PEP_ID=MMETSP0580-20130426/18603_1 /TAXON_ID=1118495 /ORGANISM="Dactyliosolen fragilissimus" /LENGTH=466 /DNA_ID=CAMNT_0027364871 /DNA_START=27 /DNA_END=1427 /DNA_ORIENTATION=-